MSRRVVFRVRLRRGRHLTWWVLLQAGRPEVFLHGERTKAPLVKLARRIVRRYHERTGVPTQLVVHTADNRFQFEHTYPRSSDPRRSHG